MSEQKLCPQCGHPLRKQYTGEEITIQGGAYPYNWHCINCRWKSQEEIEYPGFGEQAQEVYRAISAQFPEYKDHLDR